MTMTTDTTTTANGSAATDVAIRMFNPGFGDCFLITVSNDESTWRMLVDCGVHSHGRVKIDGASRPIDVVVDEIIDELRGQHGDAARLDVIVATHRHADHISGFATAAWEQVDVGEVWVPFVEDPDDEDAQDLRNGLAVAAETLEKLTESPDRTGSSRKAGLKLAHEFAVNSVGNAAAMSRLLEGRFHGDPAAVRVRYLPSPEQLENTIATGIPDVVVHVLGPTRDRKQLKRMDPSAAARWLQAVADERKVIKDENTATREKRIFAPIYQAAPDDVLARNPQLVKARDDLRLLELVEDDDEILQASSVLERSVNNTSVFFVLDVKGTRFLFVGDSQQGAWDHVLDDPHSRELVQGAAFYKIGHHGSHNATPKRFVTEALGDGATAMLPYGLVKAWEKSIPKRELMDALVAKGTRIIRADDPEGADDTGPDRLWSEVRFTVA